MNDFCKCVKSDVLANENESLKSAILSLESKNVELEQSERKLQCHVHNLLKTRSIDKFLIDVMRHTSISITCAGIDVPDEEINGVSHTAGQFIRAIRGVEFNAGRWQQAIPLKVINAVISEMQWQFAKFGEQHIRGQTVEGHLLLLRKEIHEAEDGWMKNLEGRNSVESELIQVAAVAIQALISLDNQGKL